MIAADAAGLDFAFLLTIFIEDGRLFGQATGQGPFPLTAAGEDEFEFPAADIRVTFMRSGDGPARELTLLQAGPVFAYETDRFFVKAVDAQLQFERGDDDAVVAVVLHQAGQRRAPRMTDVVHHHSAAHSAAASPASKRSARS